MVDGTASRLIFFIAATVIAVTASGILAGVVLELANDVDIKGDELRESLRTDITIINDPGSVPTDPLKIYVKNTGSNTLDQSVVSVFVDGAFVSYSVSLMNGATYWRPSEVIEVQVTEATAPMGAGDHQVRIVTESGRSADFSFRL